MKRVLGFLVLSAMFAATANASPSVAITGVTENDGVYTIAYTLVGAPAVVTFHVMTNGVETGGVTGLSGAVNRLVETEGSNTLVWDSRKDRRAEGTDATFAVRAWDRKSPPDYLVVNLLPSAPSPRVTYYPDVESLPGGLLENPIYRTTSLVMRRIHAANITWTMAGGGSHSVTLASDYYIGVFEVTQAQWYLVFGGMSGNTPRQWTGVSFQLAGYRWMRPMEHVFIGPIRTNAIGTYDYWYPNEPEGSNTFIGKLRTLSGIDDFDLPGEAQWEYACRAGHGVDVWGDGSPFLAATDAEGHEYDVNMPGRCNYNGGVPLASSPNYGIAESRWTDENGTATVGSFRPNSWGLYDMHGNVWELCLDKYLANLTAFTDGRINAYLQYDADRTTVNESLVIRGGNWKENSSWQNCKSSYRGKTTTSNSTANIGFRVICYHGLDTWTPPAE